MARLDSGKVDDLLKRAQREVDEGLTPACQVALALDGEVVVAEAFGHATTDTRFCVFSATKPLVASAVWQLIGEGALDPSHRIAEHIPEFGTNGKDVITLEQVMVHTSGFPRAPLGPPVWWTREARCQRFGKWRLNWEPGTAFEYHPTSAHWVLAELIERLDGVDYRDAIHRRITEPLGLPRLLGLPEEDQRGIAELEERGDPVSPDELEQLFGVRELPVGEVTNEALLAFNGAEIRALGVPGGGGIMRASDLVALHQAFLHNTNDLWDRRLLDDVTSNVRNTFPDPLMGVPANRTLGLVVAGDGTGAAMRGFGKTVSPRTFGHNGAAGQVAWTDPATGLSFAYVTAGIDVNVIRQARRGVALSSRAGVCATA